MLLSAVMRTRNVHKFTVIILATIFLMINVADAFGYVWCLGDDGHVALRQVGDNGCCDPDRHVLSKGQPAPKIYPLRKVKLADRVSTFL